MTVSRSPDGAKRNPGTNDGPTPDCASLHPGYYGRVICPTGYFVSSARDKNISLPRLVETALLIPLSRPTDSLSWLWIPGSRFARPGMTVLN